MLRPFLGGRLGTLKGKGHHALLECAPTSHDVIMCELFLPSETQEDISHDHSRVPCSRTFQAL